MRIVTTMARILLGLVFVVFGLKGCLHFLPMPAPEGLTGEFMQALFVSHDLRGTFALQLVGGALLLVDPCVPLALTLPGPVLVNSFGFHALMEFSGLPVARVAIFLWLLVFSSVWPAFAGVFVRKTRRPGVSGPAALAR